jgi:hypothetical protein
MQARILRSLLSYSLSELTCRYADIYCHVYNDSRQDPGLSVHLVLFDNNVRILSGIEDGMKELIYTLFFDVDG